MVVTLQKSDRSDMITECVEPDAMIWPVEMVC